MHAWRQEQQALATSSAKDEERAISYWWKQEAEKLWALQSQRRRHHLELATRHEAELAIRENQGADVRLFARLKVVHLFIVVVVVVDVLSVTLVGSFCVVTSEWRCGFVFTQSSASFLHLGGR